MSVFNAKMFRLIGLLFVMMTLAAFNARAALPDAGTAIGTQAVVQYEIDNVQEQSESNIVFTRIAQVYATQIEIVDGIVGKAGETVDIRFAVRNIGNGSDNLKLEMSNTAGNIASFVLMPADDNGAADEADRKNMNMGEVFERNGIARDQLRRFVARIAIPDTAPTGDLKFEIKATNSDNKTEKADVTVKIADSDAFIVRPVANVTLDKNKRTYLEFVVAGGAEVGAGYFELVVAKKSEPETAVDFSVLNDRIVFGNDDIASKATDTKTVDFSVDAIKAKINTSFKMGIEIPNAVLGDDYVMYVKYAAKKDDTPTKSAFMQIGYAHTMAAPTLNVIGNSAASSNEHAVIKSAVSGDQLEYVLTLKNNSSRPERFSLELGQEATAIGAMSLADRNGSAFGATTGSGLPETGLIGQDETITFKLKVALKHGITAETAQKLMLTVKSLTEAKTEAVKQDFLIQTVVAVDKPQVQFLAKQTDTHAVSALNVPGRDDVASFYMVVATPEQSGATQRDYQIAFDSANTSFQRVGDAVTSPASAMMVKVGNNANAGVFLVKTNMRGADTLDIAVTVVDVLSKQSRTETIQLKKAVEIGFVETSYSGNGSPDLDTVLDVNVMNYGGAIDAGEYEIHAPAHGEWKFSFSLNGGEWATALPLPKMASLASQSVKVKIRVPMNVKANAIESLQLALRKTGAETDNATVAVTLSIGKSKLQIEKKFAVVKKGAAGEKRFITESSDEVKHGDTIWYQIVVKNPINAPLAKHVQIIDTLPPHVKFDAAQDAGIQLKGNSVVMEAGEMEAGASKTMEYHVTVELRR
ncbi:MAG TPA: hypothetical protein VGN04_17125 [Herbaspirillum sp.]|jgi:uncharacterized repeat protein (TIGR01451 family)